MGSFGDNELSPECLDGAQKFLKVDGISIPSSYTSFLAPLSTTKLHRQISDKLSNGKCVNEAWETSYVVRVQRARVIGIVK